MVRFFPRTPWPAFFSDRFNIADALSQQGGAARVPPGFAEAVQPYLATPFADIEQGIITPSVS